MLPQDGSVSDFLEGREVRKHDGRKVPYIAVPTSSGTGSEATKNAVLSRIGEHGFKASLRHDNFIPDVALIDPELARGVPPAVTAASGMDALTQCMEAFVCSRAQPMTDAQIEALVLETVYENDERIPYRDYWVSEIGMPFARAIERAHGIGSQP